MLGGENVRANGQIPKGCSPTEEPNALVPRRMSKEEGRPEFTFYDGPPFATGMPHYGHILAGTIKVSQREFFIDNLLVRIHFIIEMILVDWPCAMGVWIPFSR